MADASKQKSVQLRALWSLTQGQRRTFGLSLVCLFIGTLFLYAGPQVVRWVIDGVLDHSASVSPRVARMLESIDAAAHPHGAMLLGGAIMFVLTAVGGVFMYFRGRFSSYASEQIARTLRMRLYDHLQHLPVSHHDKAQTGDQVQRCTSDVDTVRLLFSSQAVEIARAVALLSIGLPLMFWMDPVLALVGVAMLPIIIIFSIIFFGRVRGSFKKMDDAEGAMTATLQENLTGIRVVRAFARQEFESQRFGERNRNHRDLNDKLFLIMAIYWASSDLLTFAQAALVLYVGSVRVQSGAITIGTLVTFLSYMTLYLWPVRQMGRVLTELGKATVSIGRIQEILDAPRETDISETTNGDRPARITGDVRIENVTLHHGSALVLDAVSLHIPAGRTLAIVGPSGSGKTTLIQLLLRFYDYETGSITLDGMEIRDLPRKYVRQQFGVVMQEPFLYSKSLKENIRLGRQVAEEAEIIESATVAAVHESIESFDQKYDTLVGERGVTLSGGQRQRVAIARALLRDAPVLILDDALSAVDTHTETMILDALKKRRGQRTTIVIAHRLSTLSHADQIAVLEHGKIAQLGTHDQLVSQDGIYKQLWQIQTALEEDLSRELGGDALPLTSAAAVASEET